MGITRPLAGSGVDGVGELSIVAKPATSARPQEAPVCPPIFQSPPRVRYTWTMLALVCVVAFALLGPDAAAAPVSPEADSDAIYAAIAAGDPALTKPPASLDSLVAATELAEERLRNADDLDDVEDFLTLAVQGRRAAYARTSDAMHLCRLVAAADHVLARKAAPPRLTAAASGFREKAERDRGAQPCGEAPPAPTSPSAQTILPPTVTAKPEPPPARPVDRHDRRRLRAGIGTLVPGLVLFVPVAALLAVRAGVRGDLADLAAATATRPATAAETSRIDLLDDRYSATTAAAAVLGATGGVLVVAGAVLLTAKRRPPRAALAPWGGRGAYGLVLQGRF